MAAKAKHVTKVEVNRDQFYEMVDLVSNGANNHNLGEVAVHASPRAVAIINGIYAKALPDHPTHILWRDPGPGLPPDWKESTFCVRDQMEAGYHSDVPRHATLPVDDWNGDHFGLFFSLLAMWNGLTPAIIDQNGKVRIIRCETQLQ
ncbi:hypothetical protein ACVWWO_006445 [Bradyrhizobium sp. F1.13.1]